MSFSVISKSQTRLTILSSLNKFIDKKLKEMKMRINLLMAFIGILIINPTYYFQNPRSLKYEDLEIMDLDPLILKVKKREKV